MSELSPQDRDAARLALVKEHMAAEDAHDFARALGTFRKARYEVSPTGEVHAGADPVMAMYRETDVAFPDFHFENPTFHPGPDSVIVEVDFVGTHLGSWRGLPATGRVVRYRMCNVFVFEGLDLVGERLHFDLLSVLQQVGIARDPTSWLGRALMVINHPVTVVGAAVRSLFRSRAG